MSLTISRASLLVELGTEELPPQALPGLGQAFAEQLATALAQSGLVEAESEVRWYATPRRLAAQLPSVARRQPDQVKQRRGPSVKAAFDPDGHPTRAAEGFARACDTEVSHLVRQTMDGGEYLVWRSESPGLSALELIPRCIEQATAALPVPKRMRWGQGETLFVRPVHWAVVLHGRRTIKCNILGIQAGNRSRGHRFLANKSFPITDADHYVECLREHNVIVDFDERRNTICQQAKLLADRVEGHAVLSPKLLDLVTALVESPHALRGSFDAAFLEMPSDVLVASMRDHQKYFHLTDDAGELLPHFIAVSNIPPGRRPRIRQGNERVLKARLADAHFFLEEDYRQTLEQRLPDLKGLVFHRDLGNVYDKSVRLEALAGAIADLLSAPHEQAARAARLAKTDLVTAMVGEFPELQGIMGRHYAAHDGEGRAVAAAIEEHYLPRFAGDRLPSNRTACIVAVADKIDSIVGIFSTGEEPTGDKDPYALRRAALGIIRVLVDKRLDLDLDQLFALGAKTYSDQGHSVTSAVCDQSVNFVTERYRAFYSAAGYRADEIAAVQATGVSRVLDFENRLKAVARFRKHPAAETLAALNKRIRNILRQASDAPGASIEPTLMTLEAEHALAKQLLHTASAVSPLIEQGAYARALECLAELRAPTDRFFDEVMVMDKDLALRRNRLAILRHLADLFLAIADFSHLQSAD